MGCGQTMAQTPQQILLEQRLQEALSAQMESLSLWLRHELHDLNNALTPLLAGAGMAAMDPSLPAELKPLLREMETAAVEGARLVKRLQAVLPKGPLSAQPVALNDLLARVLQRLGGDARRVSVSAPNETIWLKVQSLAMEQTLETLIRQGLESPIGVVTILAAAKDDGVSILLRSNLPSAWAEATSPALEYTDLWPLLRALATLSPATLIGPEQGAGFCQITLCPPLA